MPPARLTNTIRALLLASPLVAASCAALGRVATAGQVQKLSDMSAPLTADVALTLPETPGYPVAETIIQTVVGNYGERRTSFQAILELSPDRVAIVLTAPSGPRIMSIDWTQAGVMVERTSLAPEELSALNILSDVFLSNWPDEAVSAALPSGFRLQSGVEGRIIAAPDGDVIRISPPETANGVSRTSFTHLSFGYALTIVTETPS